MVDNSKGQILVMLAAILSLEIQTAKSRSRLHTLGSNAGIIYVLGAPGYETSREPLNFPAASKERLLFGRGGWLQLCGPTCRRAHHLYRA